MRSQNFDGSKPLLYLVPTPIGNLDELSPRALEVLKNADLIASEDTRVSAKLLGFFNVKKPLVSLREHNEIAASKEIVEEIKKGKNVVYMSDAGYPCISDPGAKLVMLALDNNINVSCISGPNAALNALVSSGINPDHFYFHGFLDAKESSKNKELIELASKKETLIFYEAPHRINRTLKSMLKYFGPRKACIARELTKKHEEFIRDTLDNLVLIKEETLIGEMVIIVEGNKEELPQLSSDQILELVNSKIKNGLSTKDAIKEVSEETNINKNAIYKIAHK